MNNWIIQIAAPAVKAADMDMSLWGLVVKGGWLMIPIFILSIIAIYIACERFWILRKTGTGDEAFMQLIQEKIQKKDIEGALTDCDTENTPLAKIIKKRYSIETGGAGRDSRVHGKYGQLRSGNFGKRLSDLSDLRGYSSHDRVFGNSRRNGTGILRHGYGRQQYRHQSVVEGYIYGHDHDRGRIDRRDHRIPGL